MPCASALPLLNAARPNTASSKHVTCLTRFTLLIGASSQIALFLLMICTTRLLLGTLCSSPNLVRVKSPYSRACQIHSAWVLTIRVDRYATRSFDPLSFALGFGSHMVADIVGFHSNGGYLGSTVPSYVTEFQFMSAIDSYFWSSSSIIQAPSPCTTSVLLLPWLVFC